MFENLKIGICQSQSQSRLSLCIKSYQIFMRLTKVAAATSKMIEMFAIDFQNLFFFQNLKICFSSHKVLVSDNLMIIFALTHCFVCENAYVDCCQS